MIYKSIFLSALLLPSAHYGAAIKTQIQELEDAQLEKELIISNLSRMIAKKCVYFEEYKSSAFDYLAILPHSDKSSNLKDLLNKFLTGFETEFDNSENIKHMFKNGLDTKDSDESFRVTILRLLMEKRLITKLILKYEASIQELIQINQKLKKLIK